ncbi:hypothetical protein [Methylococcus sp. EFPC2]|uniref:hypothetical protein n=1 Tax=Methylococcus sp. EFPC2 TaxID=2812648 RepID=UPI0019689CFC|nr:hypothetical protein [Methylococcus sp. EFPC2]QSA96336.1 hypothetical protein JWZ97_14050 [Methylococcus sp. EFPC2]
MLEISALTAVLVAEVLAALLLVLGALLWRAWRRKRAERSHADKLVEHINRADAQRLDELNLALADPSLALDDDQRSHTLEQVGARERALYRLVIRAVLDHDVERLAQLDRHVRALSEPYRELIAQLAEKRPQQESGDVQVRLENAEEQTRQASAEAEHLRAQLKAALETLDEVSSEYTRMFGESKSGDELQLSRHRMLEAFQRAEALARGELPATFEALKEPS